MQQLQRHSRGASACDFKSKVSTWRLSRSGRSAMMCLCASPDSTYMPLLMLRAAAWQAALRVSIRRGNTCRRTSELQASTQSASVNMELVQRLKRGPFPPHTPLAGSIAGSFAYGTISKRLPAILDTIIRDLEESAAAEPSTASQFNAAAKSIEELQQLITSDSELQQLTAPAAASSSLVAAVASTNACLQAWKEHSGNSTWFSLPWLIIECYMYVWINVALAQQPALAQQQYDPFHRQKLTAFTKSAKSIADMAGAVRTVLQETGPGIAQEQLKQQCFEVVQYALWGNKTDLSLLVDASQLDVAELAAEVRHRNCPGCSQLPYAAAVCKPLPFYDASNATARCTLPCLL
jgi:hypothetical protein